MSRAHEEYIKSEYERLFQGEEELFHHFIMHGDEGLEGYHLFKKEKEFPISLLTNASLRCRFNTQRNLKAYIFSAKQIIPEEAITPVLLKSKNVINLT